MLGQNVALSKATCSSPCRRDTRADHHLHPSPRSALPDSLRLRGDCTPENGSGFSWRKNTGFNRGGGFLRHDTLTAQGVQGVDTVAKQPGTEGDTGIPNR